MSARDNYPAGHQQRGQQSVPTTPSPTMARSTEPMAPPLPVQTITALRSELASIAIMLQERGRCPDVGGPNFALVAGCVETYILELEAPA